MLPGKKDDKNVQQKLLSVTKSLRSEILLRKEMEDHCKKVQSEKLVSYNLKFIFKTQLGLRSTFYLCLVRNAKGILFRF